MAGKIRDRRMPRRVLDLVLSSLLLLLVSCGQVVFHEHISFDDGVWSKCDTLTFMYDGALDRDNTAGYDLSVKLRTDASYPYKDLDVLVESIDMRTGGTISVDTLHCAVFDDYGHRLGSTAGMLYQIESEQVYVPKGLGDSIRIRLVHSMHDKELHGVIDAGIMLSASSGRGQRQSSGK